MLLYDNNKTFWSIFLNIILGYIFCLTFFAIVCQKEHEAYIALKLILKLFSKMRLSDYAKNFYILTTLPTWSLL